MDLFHQELVSMLDLRHELCALAAKINWTALERKFGGLYAAGLGRPGHPICLMVGLQLLKFIRHMGVPKTIAASSLTVAMRSSPTIAMA